jgi:catechol 2,3-dioxygenase-like lactoylglutathione lyase family enzyme
VIGSFLELSLPTRDVAAALAFYESLGFVQASVGEAWRHPYAVVTDGRISLGLHALDLDGPLLTFVAPGLATQLARLAAHGIEPEHVRLDELSLNEATLQDPSGQRVRLLEARTFSPPALAPGHESVLGYFEECVLESAAPAATARFWETLGFVAFADDDATPAVALAAHRDLNLAFHDADLGMPVLRFSSHDPAARGERLRERGGLSFVRRVPPSLRSEGAALVQAPGGLLLLLAQAEG